MTKDRDLFINGRWMPGSGPIFKSINPSTSETVWEGHSASSSDVQAAISAARSACSEWSALSLQRRIAFLESFRDALNASKPTLAELISKETGKPLWESKGEIAAMVNKVGISINAHLKRCEEMVQEQQNAISITRHKPHGVVAVFGPFNFPGHLPNGHIVPALLAGNTVVFKPSEYAPATAAATVFCWEQAGLPPGVINLVQGGRETGRSLSENPGIDGLFFTGSWPTGKSLSEQLAAHPEKILALEMGGNNPLVISDISDTKAAAYATIQSAYLTSGQRCTCARRLIVLVGESGDRFLKELQKMIMNIKVGPYTDTPEPFMGPVISDTAAGRLMEAQESLKMKGGVPLVEMRRLKSGTGLISPGLMDVTNVPERPDEEYFGPFLQVIRVPGFKEAIEEANNTSYGLSAGLISNRKEHYEEFYRKVCAGIINWNVQLTGASSSAPFGGVGHSGNHRPSAYYAADYCSYPVASMEAEELRMPGSVSPGITL